MLPQLGRICLQHAILEVARPKVEHWNKLGQVRTSLDKLKNSVFALVTLQIQIETHPRMHLC